MPQRWGCSDIWSNGLLKDSSSKYNNIWFSVPVHCCERCHRLWCAVIIFIYAWCHGYYDDLFTLGFRCIQWWNYSCARRYYWHRIASTNLACTRSAVPLICDPLSHHFAETCTSSLFTRLSCDFQKIMSLAAIKFILNWFVYHSALVNIIVFSDWRGSVVYNW